MEDDGRSAGPMSPAGRDSGTGSARLGTDTARPRPANPPEPGRQTVAAHGPAPARPIRSKALRNGLSDIEVAEQTGRGLIELVGAAELFELLE